MPEITAMAAHYSDTSPIAEQAFVSAGLGGLQRAMEHYAPEQKAPFEPYAMWWIRQAMETLRSGRG